MMQRIKIMIGMAAAVMTAGSVAAETHISTIPVHPIHSTHAQTLQVPTYAQVVQWHAEVARALARDLAPQMVEYGCTNRSELVIGHLLQAGVPKHALGRVSSFYDVAKAGEVGSSVFRLSDPLHGKDFQRAWDDRFGADVPREIWLKEGLPLDVSSEIQWMIGHIAPTVTARDTAGDIHRWVIDPVLSPAAPLTIEEWRAAQNAPQAAIAWGKLGRAPVVQAAYLSPEEQLILARLLGMTSTNPPMLQAALVQQPESERALIQAALLGIDDAAAWHPRHWRGYSFVGALKDGQGKVLADWSDASEAGRTARLTRASAQLIPIRAYDQRRRDYPSAEAFLQEAVTLRDGKVWLK